MAVEPGAAKVAAKSVVGDRQHRAPPIVNGAAGVSRVAAQSAVCDRQRPVVEDAATDVVAVIRIAAKSGVGDRHGSVIANAAAGPCRVAADCAIGDRHPRAAIEAVVVDAAALALVGRVSADCAAAHGKPRVIIIDAAAEIVEGRPVGDRQPGDGHVFARCNVKHAASVVSVNGEHVGAGAADSDTLVHEQFAARQRDPLSV